MVELTKDEKTLLNEIVNDKFSVGAFSGMVFNALVQYRLHDDKTNANEMTDKLIKTALNTRLRLRELAK